MRIPLLAFAFVLAGCTKPANVVPDDILCVDACYSACPLTEKKDGQTRAKVPRWEPVDPANPEAWDEIRPQVVSPLATALAQCELNRESCVRCMVQYNAVLEGLRTDE